MAGKKIIEPTRMQVLVRNKKKYERLVEHYTREIRRLKLAIRVYGDEIKEIDNEIGNIKRREEESG